MNEVWRARSGIITRGCAGGRVRFRRPGSGRGDVAAIGGAADPRSPQGRIYLLACPVAIAVCAFTAATARPVHRGRAVVRRAGQADLARLRAPWDPMAGRYRRRIRRRSGWSWTGSTREP